MKRTYIIIYDNTINMLLVKHGVDAFLDPYTFHL